MNKLSGFLVKARFILLAFFLLLATASFFMMQKVNINDDMSKYLPDSSKMKEGTKELAKEFPDMSEPSTIRVMFDGLSDSQKQNVLTQLKAIKYVDDVTYIQDSPYYNKGDHTLYVISTKYDYDSKEIRSIKSALDEDFVDSYDVCYKSNDPTDGALPPFIVAGAVAILMIILILMTNSWTEPFLFLFSIGLSILINMGTNVFLPSVSKTTHSIASILQLVLAMDYSIILSNRYRQTRKALAGQMSSGQAQAPAAIEITESGRQVAGFAANVDPCEAMRRAIRSAIPSVCSSSLTTIVGLLALCFMNFKIGADLGIVLAKGVFISLLCVFTVLPGLIILFDKLIQKTSKKSLTIPTGGLARFEYSARIIISILFVLIFAAVFIAKDKAGITYGSPTNNNEISKVFPHDNRIVLLYSNTDEEKIPEILDYVSPQDGVVSVNTYANTLGVKMDAGEMYGYISGMLSDFGGSSDLLGDFTLDESMVRFLYYDHFAESTGDGLSLEEFLGFINSEILTNPMYASQLDEGTLSQLKEFGPLCSKAALQSDRTPAEISAMFGIKEDSLNLLMKYLNVNTISIVELLDALQRSDISTALSLIGGLSRKEKDTITFYKAIVDSIISEQKYTSSEMAYMLLLIAERMEDVSSTAIPEVDASTAKYTQLVYDLYFAEKNYDSSWKMSLEELFDHVLDSETFSSFIDDDARSMLNTVKLGLIAGKRQLVGNQYSLFVINTVLVDGEDESMDFVDDLDRLCSEKLEGQYYLIGSSPMASEMSKTFKDELNKITLITAAAIFIVVLITFRNILIPLILVLLIQCSVYITMTAMGIIGSAMNYLALLIVQSLLMGATIDYAIVFTNFYIEKRAEKDKKEALISTYKASIRTILTSGMIMMFITLIMGYFFPDPSSGEICHIISIGVAFALIMILFILPGILTVCDRLIVPRRKNAQEVTTESVPVTNVPLQQDITPSSTDIPQLPNGQHDDAFPKADDMSQNVE